jgi:hypothetical protein
MESRFDNIQRYLARIDEYGCFFLSLCSVAEDYLKKKVDLVDAVRFAVEQGVITPDYTVKDDVKLLSHLTGKRVSKRTADRCGVLKANEFSIEKWYNPRTGYNHFKRRYFDVYHDGVTVKEGYIMCFYIYEIGGRSA